MSMTDGNTAIQVSPVKEEDMAKVREVFKNALDAIVAATELSKVVATLQSDVAKLRQDIEATQARNVELDRMLSDTRRQRDDAEQALNQTKSELSQQTSQRSYAEEQATKFQGELAQVRDELGQARKERDDHGMEALGVREALDKANARLAQIHASMGIPFVAFDVPKPEPVPEPAQASPAQAPRRIYDNEIGFDWNKPNSYDQERGRYYNEAA